MGHAFVSFGRIVANRVVEEVKDIEARVEDELAIRARGNYIPNSVKDEDRLAPEEVFVGGGGKGGQRGSAAGNVKADDELTKEERKAARAKRKRKSKAVREEKDRVKSKREREREARSTRRKRRLASCARLPRWPCSPSVRRLENPNPTFPNRAKSLACSKTRRRPTPREAGPRKRANLIRRRTNHLSNSRRRSVQPCSSTYRKTPSPRRDAETPRRRDRAPPETDTTALARASRARIHVARA